MTASRQSAITTTEAGSSEKLLPIAPGKKLSPSERLMRKRAAARIRQQRCRARKRQALLEQGRKGKANKTESTTNKAESEPKPAPSPPAVTTRFSSGSPVSFPPGPVTAESVPLHPIERQHYAMPHWHDRRMASPSPIYNCISFESQRSFEEYRGYDAHYSRPVRASAMANQEPLGAVVSPGASSSKSLVSISGASSLKSSPPTEEEESHPEEEAAVAAMLSLKSGGSSLRSSASGSPVRPVPVLPPMAAPATAAVHPSRGYSPQWTNWEAERHFNGSYAAHPFESQDSTSWSSVAHYEYARTPSSSPYSFLYQPRPNQQQQQKPVEMYGV